jgi:hypothetical protein
VFLKDMNMSSCNEIQLSTHEIQADTIAARAEDAAVGRPGDELEQAQEVAPGAEELPQYVYTSDGKTWRLVDGELFCVSDPDDWAEDDWQEYDAVASARLQQRTITQFSRHHYRMSPEQHEQRRQRWAAKRAPRADKQQPKARNEAARDARPESMTSSRPRTPRTRRPSTRVNAATASPQPSPPEPDPAPAVSAVTSAPVTATPNALRPTRAARAVSDKPLDPQTRAFAHALADLLLADLLKYPPEKS